MLAHSNRGLRGRSSLLVPMLKHADHKVTLSARALLVHKTISKGVMKHHMPKTHEELRKFTSKYSSTIGEYNRF